MALQTEQIIATEIMKKVRRLDLPLKLDEITEGRGNCFPLAILAQGRRIEIKRNLSSSIQNIMQQNDPTMLRRAVLTFITKSRNKTIQKYKRTYGEVLAVIDGKTWEDYWKVMIRNYEWVDYIFIQCVAWFLNHDIIIVTTTSTERNPYITISGNLANENIPCSGTELLVGSKSNVHYQSLLPIEVSRSQIRASSPEDTINLELKAKKSNADPPGLDLNLGKSSQIYLLQRQNSQHLHHQKE